MGIKLPVPISKFNVDYCMQFGNFDLGLIAKGLTFVTAVHIATVLGILDIHIL